MLRALRSLVAAIVFAAISDVTSHDIDSMRPGDYYKPEYPEGSGGMTTISDFRRSPCPALNTLANHGYLPRRGISVTTEMLKNAVMTYYNMDDEVASNLVAQLQNVINLNDLSRRPPEHDASLVHSDSYFGGDPMTVDQFLARNLLQRGVNNIIDTTTMASVRKDRIERCQQYNPHCYLNDDVQTLSLRQAALALLGFGQGDFITVANASSFFVDEKFPADYVKPASPVTSSQLQNKIEDLK